MASASLAALIVGEKHKEIALEETDTNNVSTTGNKDNTHQYSNKSNYDMIMSKTFSSISNNLKKL